MCDYIDGYWSLPKKRKKPSLETTYCRTLETRISNTSKSTVLLCGCSNAIKTVERIRNDKDHSCSCPTMPSCPLLSPLVLSVRQDTCHLPTRVGGIIIIII